MTDVSKAKHTHAPAGPCVVCKQATCACGPEALARLSAGRYIARQKAPYFRPLLLSLVPKEAPGLGTIGVSRYGTLYFDPPVVVGWKPEEIAGALVHECLHLWLKHLERCGSRNAYVYNLASDLSENAAILECGLQLPPGGLFPKNYKFKDGLTSDEYYVLLLQLAEKYGGGTGDGDSADGLAKGKGPPGLGCGKCGGCAGNGVDDPDAGEGGEKDGPPEDGGQLTERRRERMGRIVAEAMKEHAQKGGRQAGNVPGNWLRHAEVYLEPAKVPWRQKLAHAVRVACAWAAGAEAHRYDGMSRRQAGIGWGPGKPALPRLRTPQPRVAVVVDTSGSMSQSLLNDALVEVNGILKAVGAAVDIVTCDAAVQGLGKVTHMREVSALMKGGGGTCMRPAFEALMQRREPPAVTICLSDGYVYDGGSYADLFHGARLIWALVGNPVGDPGEFGTKVYVEADGKEDAT